MTLEHAILAIFGAIIIYLVVAIYGDTKAQQAKHKQVENQRRAEEIRAKRKKLWDSTQYGTT